MRQTVFEWESENAIKTIALDYSIYVFMYEDEIVGTFNNTSKFLTINNKLRDLNLSSPWINKVIPKYDEVKVSNVGGIEIGRTYIFYDKTERVASSYISYEGKSYFCIECLPFTTLQMALDQLNNIREVLSENETDSI